MDFLTWVFSGLASLLKRIHWAPELDDGGNAGGDSNVDGTPMNGVIDIHHNPYGISD